MASAGGTTCDWNPSDGGYSSSLGLALSGEVAMIEALYYLGGSLVILSPFVVIYLILTERF